MLGAGQSAAEVVQYLHAKYPRAEVHSVFSRFGFSPADDSPYANRIFDPGTVDELHAAPAAERARLLELHRSTNYSCVDIELINELYATEYQERVRGERRLFMRRASEISGVSESDDGIEVSVYSALDGSPTRSCVTHWSWLPDLSDSARTRSSATRCPTSVTIVGWAATTDWRRVRASVGDLPAGWYREDSRTDEGVPAVQCRGCAQERFSIRFSLTEISAVTLLG